MFRIEMLAAARGDCLWIEYGDPGSPHRVLIDGGIASTGKTLRTRIEQLPVSARHFELLVVTHIDLDHIAGILNLLEDPPEGLSFGDIWFNGWKHLPEDPKVLGVKQAEVLTNLLMKKKLPWNQAFGGGPVVVPEDGRLPEKNFPGGMSLTLLSPAPERLRRLRKVLKTEVEREKSRNQSGHPNERSGRLSVLEGPSPDLDRLARSRFTPDDSEANGSSIAFAATMGGKRCLLTGDAFAADILTAVKRLARAERETRLPVDVLKLSHHGGHKNTSAALLSALDCMRYLFSTNGSVYQHPHQESVARVVVHGRKRAVPQLFFNYRCEQTRVWDNRKLFHNRYEPVYPDVGRDGLSVEL